MSEKLESTIAKLKAENEAYKQACDGMTPERLKDTLERYEGYMLRLMQYSKQTVGGNVVDNIIAQLEEVQEA